MPSAVNCQGNVKESSGNFTLSREWSPCALKCHNLTLTEALDMAQNHSFWRLLATFGAANYDDDDDDDDAATMPILPNLFDIVLHELA